MRTNQHQELSVSINKGIISTWKVGSMNYIIRKTTINITFLCFLIFSITAQATTTNLISESLGAPFRIRDYSFPDFLMLGFAPSPAAPLGVGHSAYESHYSFINDFQLSPEVAYYLQQAHANGRRPLDETDIAFITGLPKGQSFYIDGEVTIWEFAAHWGLTERIDVGLSFNYIGYGGGTLDSSIFNFHDTFDIDQHSRDLVANDHFQVVMGITDNDPLVLRGPPTSGGLSDPSIYLRYAIPSDSNNWRYNLTTGIKVPLADEKVFLSTGSWDVGFQLVADRRFSRDALIFSMGLIFPGDIKLRNFDTPHLPFFNISWLHRFKGPTSTSYFLQMLLAEHPFRETINTELSDLEFQLTTGFKWNTSLGIIGVGLTENLFNFDNTPDIGFHLTWGVLY